MQLGASPAPVGVGVCPSDAPSQTLLVEPFAPLRDHCRRVSSRAAMSSSRNPSAAISMILAPATSAYDDAYLRARDPSSPRSTWEKVIGQGLQRGVPARSTETGIHSIHVIVSLSATTPARSIASVIIGTLRCRSAPGRG